MGARYSDEQRAEWSDYLLEVVKRHGPIPLSEVMLIARHEKGINDEMVRRLFDGLCRRGRLVERKERRRHDHQNGGGFLYTTSVYTVKVPAQPAGERQH